MADTTQGVYGGKATLENGNKKHKESTKSRDTSRGGGSKETVDSVVTPTPTPPPTPTIGPMSKEVYDAVNSPASILDNPSMENVSSGDIANAAAHSEQTPEEKATTQRNARNTYNRVLDEIGEDVSVIKAAAVGGTTGLGILGAIGAGFGAVGGTLLAAFRNDAKELDRTNAITGLERNGATSDEINQALKKAGMTYSDYKANKETITGIIASEEAKGNPAPPSYKDNFVSSKGDAEGNSGQGTPVSEVVSIPDPTQQPAVSDEASRASGLMNYLNQLKYERDSALSNLSKTYAGGLQQWSQKVGVPGEVGYIQQPEKPQQITMTPTAFTYGDQNLSTGQPITPTPQVNELSQEKISELAANPLTDWNTVGLIYNKDPEELKRLAGIQPVAQPVVQAPVAPTTVYDVIDSNARKGSNRDLT